MLIDCLTCRLALAVIGCARRWRDFRFRRMGQL